MAIEKIFSGNTEEEIWQQVNNDFASEADMLEYTAIINQQDQRTILSIDIDPGGGFEGGYETTSFTTNLNTTSGYRFAIHHESFLDEIGKFFGMQDVVLGYPEFDKRVIVRTNDETKTKSIFANGAVRKVFQSMDDYTLAINHNNENRVLEFTIELGITDPIKLREIYSAFISIANAVQNQENSTS